MRVLQSILVIAMIVVIVFADDMPLFRQEESIYLGATIAVGSLVASSWWPEMGGGLVCLLFILGLQPMVYRVLTVAKQT